MKGLDYGKGYRYAHDEAGAFAAGERYWPDDMEAQTFYQPVPRGLEISIGERLAELRRLNRAASGGDRGGSSEPALELVGERSKTASGTKKSPCSGLSAAARRVAREVGHAFGAKHFLVDEEVAAAVARPAATGSRRRRRR